MGCIVLQTNEGKHFGFILCYFDDGAKVGDCVFSIIPTDPSLFPNATVQSLFARKELGDQAVGCRR